MMERRTVPFCRMLFILGCLAAIVPLGGCTQAMFTMAYLIKGLDVDGDCNALQGKRVVVVCRSEVTLKYSIGHVDQELAEEVTALLKEKVPKIKLVDHRKVAEWMDEKGWEDYAEVGKALGAEMVVGIDLEQFELYEGGQTLYKGRAIVEIKVCDCKTGEVVFKKSPSQTVYPPNFVIPVSEKRADQFRREFVHVLAEQIGRTFYKHDPYADIGQDSRAAN